MAKSTQRPAQAPAQNASPPQESNANRPAASFKYGVSGGIIEVAVWKRDMKGDDGSEFTVYNVQASRSYKDDNGWQRTDTVRGSDVPILIHALQRAYDFVLEDRAAAS